VQELFIDALQITNTMRAPVTIVWMVALPVFGLLFFLAIVGEQAKLVRGDDVPNFGKVVYSYVLLFLCLLGYRWLFEKIIAFGEMFSYILMPYEQWAGFVAVLEATNSKGFSVFGLTEINVQGLIMSLCLNLSIVLESVFDAVRYLFLSALYIFGPLAVAAALHPQTKAVFRGWLLSSFQVSFWIAIMRIFQWAILSFQTQTFINADDPVKSSYTVIFVSLLMIIAVISTPMLTASILNGNSIGPLGSAVFAGAAAAYTRVAGGISKIAGGLTRRGIEAIRTSRYDTGGSGGNDAPAPAAQAQPAAPAQPEKRAARQSQRRR
jgi:hypothetical protein